jgi:UDP-N-acetylglucosamine 2-epimerase (non-hydrolysing)
VVVAGARPNFVKVAPLIRELEARAAAGHAVTTRFVHTGQHYDAALSQSFIDDLQLPAPHHCLEVGSASHAAQTGAVMERFEDVCVREAPDVAVVVGDVNSTMACALVGAKLGVVVAHVEAGLRSYDRTMPEEINRVVTDHVSDILFAPSEDGRVNLQAEGISPERVFVVGNIMVDSLLAQRRRAASASVRATLGLEERRFAVLTLHRPSNVDDPERLAGLLESIGTLPVPVIFPVHPRTRKRLDDFAMAGRIDGSNLRLVDPLGYLSFLDLVDHSAVVLTDSGGLQEETTVLGVPCLTLRENTERPITVTEGTSLLVGTNPSRIREAAMAALSGAGKGGTVPQLWDGHTAGRIADVLLAWPVPPPS